MTYYFETKTYIKDACLYKEGEAAEYVYIVKSGEFTATKKIMHVGPKENKVESIMQNPIKVNKQSNALFTKNTTKVVEKINVRSFLLKQIITAFYSGSRVVDW